MDISFSNRNIPIKRPQKITITPSIKERDFSQDLGPYFKGTLEGHLVDTMYKICHYGIEVKSE